MIPLSTIIALARAGALEHAWAQFSAAGYDRLDDDPAALTVKGRLLKDHALRAEGDARRLFYLQSADAYQRSAALQPATYPLINAATLALLSGDRHRAEQLAHEVLERIAAEPDEPETPYYRAATEAEALLLLGRRDETRAALVAAMATAPQAWEDHASTLRQFLVIEDLLGGDPAWLALLRPPRSLHFGGHVPPDRISHLEALTEGIADILAREEIGFGFGTPSAGTGILAAEALLARGAALHLVLPSDASSFAACFVDPHGRDWRSRFDSVLESAESVETIRPLGVPPEHLLATLADDVGRGAAMLNAERLMGEAVALRFDLPGEAAQSLRTHVIAADIGPLPAPAPDSAGVAAGASLIALLAIRVGSGADEGFENRLDDVQRVLTLAGGTAVAPHLNGDSILIGYANVGEAAVGARLIHRELRARMPLRIAGHYGLIPTVRDPFTGARKPTDDGAAITLEIAGAIPVDTICVSNDFAAALAATALGPSDAHWIGELSAHDGGSAIGLYAVRPGAS